MQDLISCTVSDQKTIAAIELTSRCNAYCDFCVSWNDKVEKSLDDVKSIISQLPDTIATVVFVGGEVLVWDGLFSALSYAKQRGYRTKIHTNGLLLPTISDEKLAFVDVVNLPLDAVSEEYQLRKRQPLELLRKNLGRLMQLNKGVSITTVVTRQNLHLLGGVHEFLSAYPIQSWKLFKFTPHGLGQENGHYLSVSDEEFEYATGGLRLPTGKVYRIKDFFGMKGSLFF
ncbi:radical SAM protein [Candidatus Woesearchaeota archaeon]|nr:radical SAM protein [Candidatus Woesearchaeota archaeon]